jgi:hypothetical protein
VSAFSETSLPGGGAFTDQQSADNEARILALVELVASGEAFAIVGAGSSVSSGYPTWGALLERLAEIARKCPGTARKPPTVPDKLRYAQTLREFIVRARSREHFEGELGKIFLQTPRLTPFHDDLLSLPFRGFGTTNYDPTLQVAAELRTSIRPRAVPVWNGDPHLVGRAMRALTESRSLEYVLHFHGLFGALGESQPSTIVLAADDYERAYGFRRAGRGQTFAAEVEAPRLRTVLSALFLMRRIVFVGFSLDDPFVNEVLLRSAELSWDWGRQIHFAILPIAAEDAQADHAKADRLKRQLALETVFYETRQGDHSERDKLVKRIRQLVELPRHPAPTVASPSAPPPSPAAPGTGLGWVLAANQAYQRKTEGT